MSDGSAVTPSPQFQFDMLQGAPPAPAAEPPAPAPAAPAAPVQEPELTEYAKSLLEGVPDDHRGVLDQYLPKWDAAVERRVSMLEQSFGPVIDLVNQGHSIEELATLAQLMDLAADSPEVARDIFAKTFGWDQQPNQPVQQPQPGQPQVGEPQQFQLPPEITQTLAQNTQLMQQLAQQQQQQQLTQQQQAEDEQFDKFMTLLRQEKGDFDEDYVLSLMDQGIDGAEAVDRFNQRVQQFAQSNGGGAPATSLPAPPVLSGGPAAVGPKPVHEASDAERKALVTQMLNQANAQAS